MNIYPAIDLKNNQCVRLYQGDFAQTTVYSDNPLKVAQQFAEQGAKHLHVVDLDGAKSGKASHGSIIKQICSQTQLLVQTGGGVRTGDQVKALLDNGVSRVIVGSVAVNQPELVANWLEKYGADNIVLALDVKQHADQQYYAMTHGWQTNSNVTLTSLLDHYQQVGLQHLLCTDISVDGTMQGPNISLYQTITDRYPTIQLQASGGIGTLDHIKQLLTNNISGVILGRALYENKVNLSNALSLTRELVIC